MTKLQELRKKIGLSQSQLAYLSGVKFRMLQNYEQGQKPIDNAHLETILRLCIALKCNIGDLIEADDLKELYTEYERSTGV